MAFSAARRIALRETTRARQPRQRRVGHSLDGQSRSIEQLSRTRVHRSDKFALLLVENDSIHGRECSLKENRYVFFDCGAVSFRRDGKLPGVGHLDPSLLLHARLRNAGPATPPWWSIAILHSSGLLVIFN